MAVSTKHHLTPAGKTTTCQTAPMRAVGETWNHSNDGSWKLTSVLMRCRPCSLRHPVPQGQLGWRGRQSRLGLGHKLRSEAGEGLTKAGGPRLELKDLVYWWKRLIHTIHVPRATRMVLPLPCRCAGSHLPRTERCGGDWQQACKWQGMAGSSMRRGSGSMGHGRGAGWQHRAQRCGAVGTRHGARQNLGIY